MNKVYTRINWENEPSDNTPINETNLNKMDSALDELDNRVIAQDTSKADKTEVSTLIANVEFDESTGIITVTRKNGSSFTIDTKLEKIAINFTYDKDTQKIILTLVDGTKQYIDLSALITQYEFLDSDTITFVVQADGSIKAEVLDGSITESKLQPNYLAQIKVETAKSESYMNNASQSAKSSSDSANMSKSYAVGGTGTREGEDTDNAKYYSDNAKPLAKTVSGTNQTITDSTKSPLIYGKFNGYTVQDGTPTPDAPIDIQGLGDSGSVEVKTCGKNLLNAVDFLTAMCGSLPKTYTVNGVTIDICENGDINVKGTATNNIQHYFYGGYHNTTEIKYCIELKNGDTYVGSGGEIDWSTGAQIVLYDYDGTNRRELTFNGVRRITMDKDNYYPTGFAIGIKSGVTVDKTYKLQIEKGSRATDYEPYTETTASIPITSPLYDGDYMEVYADGSGKIVRNMITLTNSDITYTQIQNTNAIPFTALRFGGKKLAASGTVWCNIAQAGDVYSGNDIPGIWITNDKLTTIRIRLSSDNTTEELQEFTDNVVNGTLELIVVAELIEPTEEPLTPEQVQAFKQLYTFDNVTNVLCDGETTVRYYVNNDCGDTAGMLHEYVDKIKNDLGGLKFSVSDGTLSITDGTNTWTLSK